MIEVARPDLILSATPLRFLLAFSRASMTVRKRNPIHLFAQLDGVWNTRQHETKANWSLFKSENPSYRLSFYLSRAYRDPTVQTTQYNGLCHVTLYHNYPLWSTIKLQEPSQETRKLVTLCAPTHHWRAILKRHAPQITIIQNTHSHIFFHQIPLRMSSGSGITLLMSSGMEADTMSGWTQMGESWIVLPTCT